MDKQTQRRYIGLAAMMGIPLDDLKKFSDEDTTDNPEWIDIPEPVMIDRQILLMELRNGWK
jgi:hypothetical protein